MNSNRTTHTKQPIIDGATEADIHRHYLQISSRIYTEFGLPEIVHELMNAFVIKVPLDCKKDHEYQLRFLTSWVWILNPLDLDRRKGTNCPLPRNRRFVEVGHLYSILYVANDLLTAKDLGGF